MGTKRVHKHRPAVPANFSEELVAALASLCGTAAGAPEAAISAMSYQERTRLAATRMISQFPRPDKATPVVVTRRGYKVIRACAKQNRSA